MKIKAVLSLLACLFLTLPLATAQQANIRGTIIDEKEKTPVEYATITLLKQDSTLITGTTSDQHGKFTVNQVDKGNYILSVSFMGYENSSTQIQVKNTEYYVPIELHPSSFFLNEVTVAASSVINKGDKISILPSETQIKSATDGIDLLNKMQLSHIMIDAVSGEVTASGNGQFTGGLKHIRSYTDNRYTGTTAADVSMKQSESFAYAEYQLKTGKWSYMANLTFSCFYYSQHDNKNEKYALQPSLRVSYDPMQDLHFRYSAALKNNTPSIACLNEVEQSIDRMQIRRGNSNLKSYRSINQSFNATYHTGIFNADALVTYDYEHHPIMESVFYEDNLFVRTYENQQSFQNIGFEIAFTVKPWKDHINFSVIPCINRYISHGNEYLHTYTMKAVRVNLDFSYRNWIVNFTTITPPNRNVYGEQLMKGDLMHTLMAGYKTPAWSVMAGLHNPFINVYRSENENWSALNPVKSDIHSKNMARTFVVKFNFNLNFGQQTKHLPKTLRNMDDDPGIMSGSKN